jgi:hypothetical protein
MAQSQVGKIYVGANQMFPGIFVAPPDPDAQAFLTATGITDPTITSAINTLVVSLKANSLYTKFDAIWPMVGGTSTTCKYNLINPQDTNAAFRLTFGGGITFASTGITGNGISGFANTHLAPNSHLSLNNTHISTYLRTSGTNISVEMGIQGGTDSLFIAPFFNTGVENFRGVNATQVGPSSLGVAIPAFYQANRIASGTSKQYRNGSILNTDSVTSGTLSTRNILLLAYNNNSSPGNPLYPSTRQCAFSSVGEGMTDSEASTFYTIVQTFQTTLGRQV